jgi:ATP-binding cassette subfamily B protein
VVLTTAKYTDRALIARVIRDAWPFRWLISAALIVSLLATPLALLRPVPLAIIVDSVLGDQLLPGFVAAILPGGIVNTKAALLLFAVLMQVGVVLFVELQSLLHVYLNTLTKERITLGFRTRLFRHLQRLSFGFHDRRGSADSLYRIQFDSQAIERLALNSLIPIVSSAFTFFSMVYVIARIDWVLMLIALVITPLLAILTRTYRRRTHQDYRELKKRESSALQVIQEVLSAFRVVKAFGREDQESERFVERSTDGMQMRIRITVAERLLGILVSVTAASGTAAVLYVGARNVQSGTITLGALLIVLSYLGQLYSPLKSMTKRVAGLQNQLASAERAYELLDEIPDVQERPGARAIARASGAVHFSNVAFGYEPGHPVLRSVDFSVPPGARVGVFGPTGAGKTTLASLLMRFYDPWEGLIQLDGNDLRDLRLDELREQFALVLQDTVLFSTTIAENIAYARRDATPAEIESAARSAHAHEFISQFPEGYSTVVGERGMRLSGGERQRVALARAFLKDAPVLILDEPTSSVDIGTEATIMESMFQLMEGRTTFMIAHRLSTLEVCDLFLDVDDGRVVLTDTPPRRSVTKTPEAHAAQGGRHGSD